MESFDPNTSDSNDQNGQRNQRRVISLSILLRIRCPTNPELAEECRRIRYLVTAGEARNASEKTRYLGNIQNDSYLHLFLKEADRRRR